MGFPRFFCFLSAASQVEFSWYRYGLDTVWNIVNSVGYFFSSMWGGADAVRPRGTPSISSRDYR